MNKKERKTKYQGEIRLGKLFVTPGICHYLYLHKLLALQSSSDKFIYSVVSG